MAVQHAEPHLELQDVSKRFGGVAALRGASLRVDHRTIHALVGENGAGKSTLAKIIAGVITPDEGQLAIDGSPVDYRTPHGALGRGVAILGQEGALVPHLTVLENVLLGVESTRGGVIDHRRTRRRFGKLSARLGFDLPPDAEVASLRAADQQKAEMLRAMAREATLLVLDEPTAVLTRDESERFLAAVQTLREDGTTIVYVSHFLDEVLRLADLITIMRDGEVVRTARAAEETPQTLVADMVGREVDLSFPEKQVPAPDAPVVLSVRGITRADALHDVSLEIRAGEIVGVAGLVGSGRSELARAIFGADPVDSGTIAVAGEPVRIRSPRDAIGHGIALLPESRKDQGLLMHRSVADNVTLPHLRTVTRAGVISIRTERRRVADLMGRLALSGSAERVGGLSGGNQQKVLFGKWLFQRPRVLLADEPTRGVDVGAKRAIYELICDIARTGVGVLLISSELEEVLGLAHRVLVMRGGAIAAQFEGEAVSEHEVMRTAFAAEEAPC